VSGHLLETVIRLSLWHTSKLWTLILGGPTLCLYDCSNSARETFYRCLNVSGGMATHSSCRAVDRAVSDVGHWGLEQSRHSNSSHRCSMGFRSGLWPGQSIPGTLLSTNHSLTDLDLWQGALSCWYKQSSSLNWSTIDSTQRVKMSLYPPAFRFPSSIMRGPSAFHEKHLHTILPPPNLLLALHMLAGIVLQAFATPKPSHWIITWYSMIHYPKSYVSSCPLSSGFALYTTSGGA
jgi:hypothetical protein